MTKLLEKAFAKVSRLPDVEQNALARWMLEELEAEKSAYLITLKKEELDFFVVAIDTREKYI